jgi:hypothetical protein
VGLGPRGRRRALAAALILVVVMMGAPFIFLLEALRDPVGPCLDGGGCWDAVDQVCRQGGAGAQGLCDRNPETPGG